MARGAIATVTSTTTGVEAPTPTTGDAVNGHYVTNTGKTKIHVKNTNGASTARTVTFHVFRTVDGQTVTSKTKAVPAGKTWIFGPFDRNDYGSQILIDVDNAELTLFAVE